MAKVTLTDLVSSFLSKAGLNNNFQKIEDDLNNRVLYRDNPTGEPNQMESVLDMNSKRLINLPAPQSQSDALRLADIPEGVEQTSASLVSVADTDEYFVETSLEGVLSEIFETSQTKLAKNANLSDVDSASVSRNNLGLGTAALVDVGTASGDVPTNTNLDNRGFVGTVEDVATLQAGSFPSSLSRLWLLGYYGVGTAGGGPLYRDDSDTSTADNGGTVFVDVDGVRWKRAQEGVLTPAQFGARGDGTTNDTSAIQSAVDEVSTKGGILDFEGKVYSVLSSLQIKSNVTWRSGTLDFTGAGTNDTLLEGGGALTNTENLTNNAIPGNADLDVADSSAFSVDDYIFLQDNTAFGASSGATRSEIARVSDIPNSTTVRVRENIVGTYTTASTARISKFEPAENVVFENMNFISDGTAGQLAVNVENCERIYFNRCQFFNFDNRCVQLRRSYIFGFDQCSIAKSRATGLAYGIAIINGCQWGSIKGCHFEDFRHGVTTGGSSGVNRYVIISGNTFYGMTDSGIDSHDASQYYEFCDNIITCTSTGASGAGDGITCQGTDHLIRGNTIRNAQRHGILVQAFANVDGSVQIDGNYLTGDGANSDIAIIVETRTSGGGLSLTINNNKIQGFATGISCESDSNFIRFYTISNNNIERAYSGSGIRFTTTAGQQAQYGMVLGNTIRCLNTAAPIDCIDFNSGTSEDIEYLQITGNIAFGGDYGIRVNGGKDVFIHGNSSHGATSGDVISSGVTITATDNF